MRRASLAAGAVGCGLLAIAASAAAAQELPPGSNRDLVYGNCRTCHDLQYLVESAGIPRSAWSDIIDSMKQYGLRIAPDERAKILDYLATYLGPNPPKATVAAASSAAPAAPAADGAAVFKEQCSACHQPSGQGVPGAFPPLAGNTDLFLSRTFPAAVALSGLQGSVAVAGKTFNGVMPSFAHLSDAEIAAVVNYVRSAWGNDKLRPAGLAPLDAAAVAAVRQRKLTPAQVAAQRQQLKAAATGK
jgi:mono/diheme cytochrome c family protein